MCTVDFRILKQHSFNSFEFEPKYDGNGKGVAEAPVWAYVLTYKKRKVYELILAILNKPVLTYK